MAIRAFFSVSKFLWWTQTASNLFYLWLHYWSKFSELKPCVKISLNMYMFERFWSDVLHQNTRTNWLDWNPSVVLCVNMQISSLHRNTDFQWCSLPLAIFWNGCIKIHDFRSVFNLASIFKSISTSIHGVCTPTGKETTHETTKYKWGRRRFDISKQTNILKLYAQVNWDGLQLPRDPVHPSQTHPTHSNISILCPPFSPLLRWVTVLPCILHILHLSLILLSCWWQKAPEPYFLGG